MDNVSALPVSSWSVQLREQVQARPLTALGLLIALAARLCMNLPWSLAKSPGTGRPANMKEVLERLLQIRRVAMPMRQA